MKLATSSLTTLKEVTLALAKLVGFTPSKRQPLPGINMLAMALERFHYLKLGFNANSSCNPYKISSHEGQAV